MTENTVLLPDQRDVIQLAQDFKLDGFVKELYEQFKSPQLYQDLSFEAKLKRCLESQKESESHLRFNRLYRNSKLRNKFYIKQFVPNPSRGLESNTLLMLKEGDFIDKGINIVISGMTGTGKTALASATAVEAMQRGYSVVFYRFNDLMTIINSKDQQSFCRFRDRIKNIRLLIIDDYGLTRVPDNIVCALTEIADVRYGMGSTIITTQLRKKALKSVIDESPIRDALADRLFRDCDIEITLKGTSWRGSNEELKGEKNDN